MAEESQLKTGPDDVLMVSCALSITTSEHQADIALQKQVDAGGEFGDQVGALRKQYLDLPGLFVL